MSYDVQITSSAKADLNTIYGYLAYQLLVPQIASKQYNRIKSAILGLSALPERFALYPDEPWHSRGLRKLVVDNYLVFYRVDNENNTVVVIRIMYGGRDIDRQLNTD